MFQTKWPNNEKVGNKLHSKSYYNALESTSETKQNRAKTNRRVPQVDQSSYILDVKGTNVSHNMSLKSHYCFEELKKHEGEYSAQSGKKINRSKNSSRVETEVKRNENSCDITFLRKLLAMNKKEELVLNRKLAKLVLEEEFGMRSEANSFTKNLFSNTSVSEFGIKRRNNFSALNENKLTKMIHPTELTVANRLNNPRRSPFRTQYDRNGRRIYYDNGNYDESEDEDNTSTAKYHSGSEEENPNPPVIVSAGRSKTYINTTTVIKTKSDITCDSLGRSKRSSRRNSMTLMNEPILEKKESRVRRKQEEGTENESKYKKCLFTKVDSSCKGPSRERRESSPGDGVQNVVVHCCEVAQDKIGSDSKKKVLKVWNFNDIPKIKPGELEFNGKFYDVQQQMTESKAIMENEIDVSKDERSTRKISTTSNISGKRKSRPNTTC